MADVGSRRGVQMPPAPVLRLLVMVPRDGWALSMAYAGMRCVGMHELFDAFIDRPACGDGIERAKHPGHALGADGDAVRPHGANDVLREAIGADLVQAAPLHLGRDDLGYMPLSGRTGRQPAAIARTTR